MFNNHVLLKLLFFDSSTFHFTITLHHERSEEHTDTPLTPHPLFFPFIIYFSTFDVIKKSKTKVTLPPMAHPSMFLSN